MRLSHNNENRRHARLVEDVIAGRLPAAGLARLLNAPVGVMLTDRDGVILGYTGAATFAEIAHRSGLREGAALTCYRPPHYHPFPAQNLTLS